MTATKTRRTSTVTTKEVAAPVQPALISPREYVADFRTRLDIHNREVVALVKDLYAAGQRAHELVDQAVSVVKPTVQPLLARIRG